MSDIPRIIFFA